jgi:hypothetical protein
MDLDTIAALSLANIAPEVIRVGQAALGANTAGAVAYGLFSGGTATVAAAIGGYFQAGLERTGAGVLEEHRDLEVGMSSILVALQEPGGLSDMTKSALRYTMMRQGMQLAGTLATDIQETGSAWRTVTDSAKRIAIQWKRSSKTERAGAVAAPFAAGVGGAVAGGAIAVTTGTATGGVATGVGLGAFAVALIAEIAYLSRSNSAAAEELRSQMTQMRLQENENRLREALLKNTKNYTRIEDHDALRDQAEFTAHHLSNLRRSGASEKQIEESFASNLLAGGADQAELNGAIEFLKTSGQVTTTA